MKGFVRHTIVSSVLLLFFHSITAQVNVRATINRDRILIGQPLSLTIEAYMPLGTDFNWFRADSIPAFQITEVATIDTAENMDGKKVSQTLLITSFDSGRQYIPPFEILVNSQPFYTDSIPVEVSYTPFDPNADYRDIKNIIEVVNPQVKYIPWMLAAMALLSAIGLVIIWTRKKKYAMVKSAPVLPALTPYEEAMRSLRELKKTHVREVGVKTYYSALNDILRTYLSREYSIATFERTNEELILQISRLNLPRENFLALAQALRMSDFVKFAKYVPGDSDNDQNIAIVSNAIDMLNKRMQSAV